MIKTIVSFSVLILLLYSDYLCYIKMQGILHCIILYYVLNIDLFFDLHKKITYLIVVTVYLNKGFHVLQVHLVVIICVCVCMMHSETFRPDKTLFLNAHNYTVK